MLAEKIPFYSGLSWQKKYKGLYSAIDSSRIAEFLSAEALSPAAGQEVVSPAAGQEALGELPARFHFIMPQTYMNKSGESVHAAASFFKIKNDSILVVHDELELPLGTISLKFSGGLGGHNGLRSMKACFGNADFWRLRIGIGRPDSRLPGEGGPAGSGEGIVDWVLSEFSAEEAASMDAVLEAAARLFIQILGSNPETLLKKWAKKKVIDLENQKAL